MSSLTLMLVTFPLEIPSFTSLFSVTCHCSGDLDAKSNIMHLQVDKGKESWPTTCTGFPDAVSLRRSSAEASAPFPFTCCPFVPLLPFCALWARFRFGFQRSQDLKCKENLTSVLFILFCKSGLLCLCNLHNQNSCVISRSLKNCKCCLKKLGDTSRKSGTKYKQCKFQFHSIC